MEAKKLAELCYRLYESGDISDDAAFDIEDFEDAVQSARAYKIKLDFWNSIKMEGERNVNSTWFESFDNVAVKKNETTNTYYSVLPSQVFGDLPKGRAFNLLCPVQDPNSPFIPMTKSEIWLYSSLPQDDTIYYNFDGTKINYERFNPNIKEVYMQYIPQTSETIPDEIAYEIRDLVINQFLKPKQVGREQDKMDDSNSDIRQPNGKQ